MGRSSSKGDGDSDDGPKVEGATGTGEVLACLTGVSCIPIAVVFPLPALICDEVTLYCFPGR